MRASLCTCALLVGANALAAPARAGEPTMAGADVERAQTYVDLGTRLYKQKKFAEALQEFERAENLVTVAETRAVLRYNIARCHEELGRPVAAWYAFKRYLELPDSPEAKAKALARIAALEAGHFGRLRVHAQPTEATCTISPAQPAQGVPETQPCPAVAQAWPRGTWKVSASLAAPPRAVERQVEVAVGAEARLKVDLPAWLIVRVDAPDAEVRVNGQAMGAPSAEGVEVLSGPTRIELSRAGQLLWRAERALTPGEVATLDVPPGVVPAARSVSPQRGAWPWVVVGGAVAAFAGAGVMYAQSVSAADAGDAAAREMSAATDRAAFESARQRVRASDEDAARNYTIALGCAATGAALSGLAAWLFWDSP